MKVLIGCCKRKMKSQQRLPPYRLYQGVLFRAQYRYASWVLEAELEDIYVLSAKHGLISYLSSSVAYYDETLPASARARVEWAEEVAMQIAATFTFTPGERLYILAGKRYREPLIGMLGEFEVINPVPAGMGYGQQVKWLDRESFG